MLYAIAHAAPGGTAAGAGRLPIDSVVRDARRAPVLEPHPRARTHYSCGTVRTSAARVNGSHRGRAMHACSADGAWGPTHVRSPATTAPPQSRHRDRDGDRVVVARCRIYANSVALTASP
eukprot:2326266-Prymnesium_polylepis.1